MVKKIVLVSFIFAAQSVFAAPVLTPKEDTGKKIYANIPVYKSAEVLVDGKPVTLAGVGTGIRSKFAIVKVYGGEVYSTDPTPLKTVPSPDYPVKGIDADSVTVVAVQMSFLH